MSQVMRRSADTVSALVPARPGDEVRTESEAGHSAIAGTSNRSPFHVINGVAYPRDGFDIDRVIAFLFIGRTLYRLEDEDEDETSN